MTKENFFVGVSSPKEIRRELLISSKQTVEALVAYEKYKDVREQKLNLLNELKKSMDSLVFLNKKLRSHLPRMKEVPHTRAIAHDHVLEMPKAQVQKGAVQKKPEQKPVPKRKSRLEQLREDLDSYEKKLANLE